MFYFFTPARRRTAFLSFLIFISIFSGCRAWQNSSSSTSADSDQKLILPEGENSGFPISASGINLSKPLEISTRPEDAALCDKINQTIEESEFKNARWGVVAISLKDGRVICGRDARKLFNPASIEKTLTAIVALDTLGADFRWRTSVYAQNQIAPDGTLNGDLTLYGTGAPDFDSKALEQLVTDLQAKGLKRVRGNVIGDASYFRGSTLGDGWTWNELQWYYGAEASALSFNDNQGFINVENGVGKASNDLMNVTTATATPQEEDKNANGNSNAKKSAGLSRGLDNNEFYVWGTNQNWGARVAVHNPEEWAARAFKDALGKHGIAVEGEAKYADWKSENKLDTSQATELAFVESQPLGEIVKKMNKRSVNLYAELLLRTIGRKFRDTAPADNARPEEVRGDDNAGAAIIKKWLREHNVATDEIEIYDGSGLSRLDFVTPEAFGRAFIYAAQSNYAQVFIDSLPVAATDGTLGGRLGKVKGDVMAKTGTVTYVNSLAGYAQNTAAGENLTFAIICNNQTRKAEATVVIDKIATLLVKGIEDEKDGKNANSSAENKTQKEEQPK